MIARPTSLARSLVIKAAVIALLAVLVAPISPVLPTREATAAVAPIPPGTTVYFPKTGQSLTGPFLAYWLQHRDIGLPVSTHVQHGLHLTQWFEYARLELRWVPLESATVTDIYPLDLGSEFAAHVGYADHLSAFTPKDGGPERFFPETGHSLQLGFRTTWEQPGMAERLGLPISDEFASGATTYQFFQRGALTWESSTGVRIVPLGILDAGLNGRLAPPQPMPQGAIDVESPRMIELADAIPGERWIEVNLSTYEVTAWVDDLPVLKSTSIVGSPNSPTVTGNFAIYLKYEEQDLSGITWTGAPYSEPGVPWVMYFYSDFGFHGTTWRTSYGYGDSEGCVIPPNAAAQLLWEFAPIGTRVWVHY